MRKNHQLNQPSRKVNPKIVYSQDARKIKVSRKNQNSQSPVPRQTHMNKENINPNMLQTNSSTNKLLKNQKPSSEHMQNTVVKMKKDDYREQYFQIKDQSETNKINKNGEAMDKNVNSIQERQEYFGLEGSFERIGLPMPQPQQSSSNMLNFHDIKQHFSKRNNIQNTVKVPLKEVKIKLDNRSLQKCQLYHQKETPKAAYLIPATSNENYIRKEACRELYGPKCKEFDFICCEECGKNFSNKILLRNIGENTLNSQGLTVRQYFRNLHGKSDFLKICKENIKICFQKFDQMSSRELMNVVNYYNSILEIIEISMKNAEKIICKQKSLGEQILNKKIEQIHEQSVKVEEEMKKLIHLQEKGFKADEIFKQKLLVKENFHIIDMEFSKIQLPIFQVFVHEDDQLLKFAKEFDSFFSLKILTSEDIPTQSMKDTATQKAELQEEKQNQHYISYYNSNGTKDFMKSEGGFSNFSRKAVVDPNDIDLFCDEEMGMAGKINNFSFEQKSAHDPIGPEDCIIQLTEEQDIISPAFKAI